jgi:hypothetical protein
MVGPPSSWSRDQEDSTLAGPLSRRVTLRSCVAQTRLSSTPRRWLPRADRQCAGGEKLFKTAIALLIVWLLGVFGVYHVEDVAKVSLLVGLMMPLIVGRKGRDADVRRDEPRTD